MKHVVLVLLLVFGKCFAFDYYRGVPIGLGSCYFLGKMYPCVIVETGTEVNIILQDNNNREVSVYHAHTGCKPFKQPIQLEK